MYQESRSPFKSKIPMGKLTMTLIAWEAPGENEKARRVMVVKYTCRYRHATCIPTYSREDFSSREFASIIQN